MSTLHEVGERDGWRCWLCDEPVDPDASVNADRGPSIDGGAAPKGKKPAPGAERLAHRACNTKKGAVKPVVAWSPDLFVVDPAPDRRQRRTADAQGRPRGGRPLPDARGRRGAAAWLVDRLSRFAPDLRVAADVEPGGGQFLLVLRAR